MAKLSAEEKATLDALTKKAEEKDDDEDFNVTIERPDGSKITLPHSRAKAYLAKNGIDLSDVKPDDEEELGEDGLPKVKPGDKPKDKKTGGYFSK